MTTLFAPLASSSSGNALLAVSGQTRLLVDAGISLRRLTAALSAFDIKPEDLTAVLITHEHSDHVSGLPLLAARTSVPIYTSRGTAAALAAKTPALSVRLRAFASGDSFEAASAGVETFSTPHDTPDSVGYILHLDSFRAAVVTDLGHVPDWLPGRLAGTEAILLESNHDIGLLRAGGYPAFLKRRISGDRGHLSNEHASRAAILCARSGTKHIVLGHLSRENNRPDLAYSTTYDALTAAGVRVGRDVTLEVAPPVFGVVADSISAQSCSRQYSSGY